MKQETGIITDDWILSYAAGALGEGHAMIVATHAAYHDEIQDKVHDAEAIGGSLLDAQPAATISDTLFDDLMASLDDDTVAEVPTAEAVYDNDIPAVLSEYLGKSLDDLKWGFMGPGLRQCQLWQGKRGEKLWLLKAKGGANIPIHDHQGLEMTLILRGSYHVGADHYTKGLVELAEADSVNHEPSIDEGEDCICLVVTEAPIKIHSLIGRMFQPFIGL